MQKLRQNGVIVSASKAKMDDEILKLSELCLQRSKLKSEPLYRDRKPANTLCLPVHKSLGASTFASDASLGVDESLDGTLTNSTDVSVKKLAPRRRRRLRLENDENSVLDTTLQESIRDVSPVRGYRAVRRMF